MRPDNPVRPGKVTWAGLALVMPSTLFWFATILAGVLHQDVLAKPITHLMQLLDFWFVLGVLIVMPILGGILAAIGFHRRHMTLNIVVMLLGFGAGGLAVLMNTTPPPVH